MDRDVQKHVRENRRLPWKLLAEEDVDLLFVLDIVSFITNSFTGKGTQRVMVCWFVYRYDIDENDSDPIR